MAQRNLAYSGWHRTLGFSYFAMDLDNIEVRQNAVVGLIESSTTTARFPEHKDVFNRFLSETGGFQFEVAYWFSRWLDVPAFVVSMKPLEGEDLHAYFSVPEQMQVLNLLTAETTVIDDFEDFNNFICGLPKTENFFEPQNYELPELLEKLAERFDGIKRYPYFDQRKQTKWLEDYAERSKEIIDGTPKTPSKRTVSAAPPAPVKGETTGERKDDYGKIRDRVECPRKIALSRLSIDWIEWRKENSAQTIGRPAAAIKTVAIEQCDENVFIAQARAAFMQFHNSLEYQWYSIIAAAMQVKSYFCAYEKIATRQKDGKTQEHIGDQFVVYEMGYPDKKYFTRSQYEDWIKSI